MHILVHTPVRVFVQSLHLAAVGACQQRSRSRPQSTSLANMLSRECFPRSPHPVCGWSVCVHIHSEWRHRDAIPTIADYIHLSHAPNTHSIYQAHLHNRAHACPLILLYIIPQPICRLWGSKHLLSLSFLFSPPAQILPAKRIFRPWPLENTWERNYRLNQTWACQYVSGEGGKRKGVNASPCRHSQSARVLRTVFRFFFKKKFRLSREREWLNVEKKIMMSRTSLTAHARQPDGAQDSTISPSISDTGSLRETTRFQGQYHKNQGTLTNLTSGTLTYGTIRIPASNLIVWYLWPYGTHKVWYHVV